MSIKQQYGITEALKTLGITESIGGTSTGGDWMLSDNFH